MVPLSASKVWIWVQRDGGIWSFLTWTKIIYRFTGIRKWVMRWWKRPSWFSKKINVTFSLNWSMPYRSGCSQVLISSKWFDSSICDWKNKFSFFLWEISPLSHWVFLSTFPMRPSPPTPQGLQPICHPTKFTPRVQCISRNNPGKTFFPNWWILDWYFAVIGQYSTTSEPNGIIGPWNGCPKRLSYGVFPIRQEICNISQIGKTFHRICPPIFIQTWLQQYSRGAFLYSAHCSFSNPICFWSVWCWRTVIPGEIFTGFAKLQGIVSVSDFRFPIWLQELLQASLCFLRSFCFARIRLDPLGGQVLHHDCTSMIVSRFTIFTENFVTCCNQVTKIFCTRYGSANASSAWGPCNFGPFTDLAISVYREMSINAVLTRILTSLGCGL